MGGRNGKRRTVVSSCLRPSALYDVDVDPGERCAKTHIAACPMAWCPPSTHFPARGRSGATRAPSDQTALLLSYNSTPSQQRRRRCSVAIAASPVHKAHVDHRSALMAQAHWCEDSLPLYKVLCST